MEVVASPNGVNHNTSPANHKATSDQQLHTSTYIPVVDVDSSVNLIIILWEKTHTQIEHVNSINKDQGWNRGSIHISGPKSIQNVLNNSLV